MPSKMLRYLWVYILFPVLSQRCHYAIWVYVTVFMGIGFLSYPRGATVLYGYMLRLASGYLLPV